MFVGRHPICLKAPAAQAEEVPSEHIRVIATGQTASVGFVPKLSFIWTIVRSLTDRWNAMTRVFLGLRFLTLQKLSIWRCCAPALGRQQRRL